MDYLPVFLQLRDRPVLVVGGGRVAARKVELLRRTGAKITVVAPELADDVRELAAKGELNYVNTVFSPEHVTGTVAVVAATGVPEVNAAVSAAAREQNIPVNVVDDPVASTFIFPAIVDRSPILIAISRAALLLGKDRRWCGGRPCIRGR
jgi:uroporphyrin-III C-methyltransferase/precorrin-2 dehydrogenase/sirohydrochlorin ferrochelatase